MSLGASNNYLDWNDDWTKMNKGMELTLQFFSLLCWLSSIDFEPTLITCLHDVRSAYFIGLCTWHYSYFIGLSKIETADSAQPRNC